jgi:hypothetical protein
LIIYLAGIRSRWNHHAGFARVHAFECVRVLYRASDPDLVEKF